MCESCLWSLVRCVEVLRPCECVYLNRTNIPQLWMIEIVEEMLTHFTGSLTESGACCIILCYLVTVLVSTVCSIRFHWIVHCSIWNCDMCLCAIKWHRLIALRFFACVSIVVCCVYSFLFISYFHYSILVWVLKERYTISISINVKTKKTNTISKNEEE